MDTQALSFSCWHRVLAGAAFLGAMAMGCAAAPKPSRVPTITAANVPCVFYRAAGQQRFTTQLRPYQYDCKQERDGDELATFLVVKTEKPLYCGPVQVLPEGTLVACSRPFDWSGRLLARFVSVPRRPFLFIFPLKPRWTPAQGIADLRTAEVKFSEIAVPGSGLMGGTPAYAPKPRRFAPPAEGGHRTDSMGAAPRYPVRASAPLPHLLK